MSTYKAGVIGCGTIARERHLPCLEQHERIDLHAVYDHHVENVRDVATEYEIVPHDSREAFLAEPLDFVTITTPPFTHAELSKAALDAGVNVLCEKPMASSVDEARAMEAAASDSDATLGVVHNFLFSHATRRAARLERRGELGEVRYVKGFQMSSERRALPGWYPDLPGGLFFDEAPHLLYLMERFIGELELASAAGETNPSARQELQSVSAAFEGASGPRGDLTMVFDAPLSEWFLVVIGTKRAAVIDIFRDILLTFDRERRHSTPEVLEVVLRAIGQELAGVVRSGLRVLRGDLFFGLDELLTRYVRSLERGRPPPVTAAEGRRTVELATRIVDACGESSAGGPGDGA